MLRHSSETTLLCCLMAFTLSVQIYGQINSIGSAAPSAGLHRREELALRNAKSKEVLKYMNLSINPCNDFYEFACGNWAKYHPPIRCEVITTQSQLELRVNKDLQIILDEPVTTHDGLAGGKVKDFYKACLTVESQSATQKTFFTNFVKKHGGLPTVPETNWQHHSNWVQVIGALRANYGMDILIGLEISTNPQTKRGTSIYLSEPTSTLLPMALCSAETMTQANIREDAYEQIQKEVADNIQTWFSLRTGEANRIAGDIVSFEFNLCKQMRKDQLLSAQDESEVSIVGGQQHGVPPYRTGQGRLHNNRATANSQYPRLSLQQLTQQFGGQIDFKQYVDTSFDSSINDPIYLRSEAYFAHLARLLETTTKPTLANYIMYRALIMLSFPHDDRPNKRPKYCIELVLRYFPKNIGDMYRRKYYREESKFDVETIYQHISKAFDDSLNVEWMDENTKRAARQKLAQFKVRFPQYQNLDLSNLNTERLDYWRKLEQVMKLNAKRQLNSEYSKSAEAIEAPDVGMRLQSMDNEVLVGWGLLQPPYFHHLYSNSLKFALLGQRLARELTLAFDEQGWNKNPLSTMHWDEFTAEGFRNRSQCFRTQLSNYLHNNPETFRNASKLREIMADSSGLNVGFRAYLSWLEYMDPSSRLALSKETLPEVNFTNTQLFFINFAQTRCAAIYTEEPTPEFMPMDRHTKERYDVNGPLANFVEFAREFNCAAGTEMNPDDKCVIY